MKHEHPEEKLALTILNKFSLFKNAKLLDKPDIRGEDENCEVVIVCSKDQCRLLFGDRLKENTKEVLYVENLCADCESRVECQKESEEDNVKCKLYERDRYDFIQERGIISTTKNAELFYKGENTPSVILYSFSLSEENLNLLYKKIEEKEEKIETYGDKPISLFVFYEGNDSINFVNNSKFKNIYIYCIKSEKIYKNRECLGLFKL